MKKIAVINDISGFGKCSLTAALPVISALGMQCCPVPTAVLSHQTGYNSYHCIDLTAELDAYLKEWYSCGESFDAILTGYMTSCEQADIILKAVDRLKNDCTLVVVDPVMADDGTLYKTYSKELCRKVIRLAKKANVITPNLTELCILARLSYKSTTAKSAEDSYFEYIAEAARTLLSENLETVIVTGVKRGNTVCNIAVGKDSLSVSQSELIGGSFSGTGDLFASIVCAELTRGMSVAYSVELATRFIEKAIRDTVKEGTDRNDGIAFEKHLEMLINE